MKLSNITVSFKRTKQVQQFEPASAEVSLTYVSEDDETVSKNAISIALATAKQQVAEALGLSVKPTEPKITNGQECVANLRVEAVKTEANPIILSAITPDVAQNKDVMNTAAKKRGRPRGSKNADPAAMEDTAAAVEDGSLGLVSVLASDPAAMEDVSVPPTQTGTPTGSTVSYTAADLARAINARMTKMVQAKIVNPSDKIKAYIETWRPAGVTGPVSAIYQHVPEDKRAEFVAKMEEVV